MMLILQYQSLLKLRKPLLQEMCVVLSIQMWIACTEYIGVAVKRNVPGK